MILTDKTLEELTLKLTQFGDPIGLEFYPFCIGWYNDKVKDGFKLQYEADTLAFCVVSTPRFFEQCFLPFVKEIDYKTVHDPFDQCMISTYEKLRIGFDESIDVIHDFELHTNRRPKMLVQTAGHVSRAACYYQKKDVLQNPWGDKKLFGVSCHPKFGGWFGFRGSMIFKNYQTPFLTYKDPEDLLSNEQKIKLLERFNYSWKDWSFRNVYNMSGEKYSDFQQQYFQCKPADRFALLSNHFNTEPIIVNPA